MSAPHPLRALIDAYNDAWNRHDVDAILALHTEDSVFCNHTSGGEAVGKEAIRRIVEGVFETFPDIRFELRRLYLREDLIVQEWTATAMHTGTIERRGETLEPTGKTVRWKGLDVIPVRGGLVARKDVYADSVSFAKQLGATKL